MKSGPLTDESLATEGSPVPIRFTAFALGKDPLVRGITILFVVAAIPLLIPILADDWRSIYGHHIIEVVFLVLLLVAIRYRLSSVEEPNERRFWNLITFGFAWWILATGTGPIAEVLFTDAEMISQIVKNGPYLIFYGAIITALEIHPHVKRDSIGYQLQNLNWVGLFVLLFGLFSYFLVVPSIYRGDTSAFWSSTLALFVAFDLYIALRIWHLLGLATTREWRVVYACLLVGVTIWGIGDLMLALMHEGIIADPGWGTPFDLIWPLAFCAVLIATRPPVVQQEHEIETTHQPLGMGPLVMYTIAPLVLHVAVYLFGVPDPEFRTSRDVLILLITALLAGMTLAYHRLLRIENARLAKEEALARENLVYQAFHDELTGLPNRNLFRDRLQVAIADSVRYQNKCGVLFCDLDQFKVINDSLGHEAGDQVLIATAERLRATVRKQDTVARFGGDEFAIIIQGVHQVLDAALLAEKLLAAISEPLVVGHKNHVLTASMGIAVFPDDGEEEPILLKHADTAMYQAKLHGRNTYRLFTEAMNEAADERLAIEQGLRTGLVDERFAVFYQPIVELNSDQPVVYEALIRWDHPERGYISPVNFIDVAEQTGVIVPIGKWVLETACTWAAQLEPVQGRLPSVSVNISSRQFRDPELVQFVSHVLKKTGLDPSRLQLEITESMALTIVPTTMVLSKLRDLGVQIAIDDFGTGYAALSLLQDLPVDIVKIDRSFVRGIEVESVSEAIVLAIVNMAKALDFYVIAEGVETASELEVIRQSKCDAAQGFYFCDPLPPEELEKNMAKQVMP